MKIRIIALLCAVLMLCGILAGCGGKKDAEPAATASAKQKEAATDPQPDTFTVHAYVPDSWIDVGIWAWSDTEGNAFDAWPGKAMTAQGNNWYTYEVPSWVTYVIINAHDGGVQTGDIPIESKEVWICVYEDGTAEYDYQEFQPSEEAVTDTPEQPVQNHDSYIVHARVPSRWYNAGIWAWSDTEGDLFEAWPGNAMTMGGDGWYSYELPNWINYVIINGNDGSVQTADISVSPKELWIVVDEDLNHQLSYTKPSASVSDPGELPVTNTADQYDAVFTSRGITDTSELPEHLHVFACVSEGERALVKYEYGYENGIVKELAYANYISKEHASQTEMEMLVASMRNYYGAVFGDVDGYAMNYQELENYYYVGIRFGSMDDAENVERLVEALSKLNGQDMSGLGTTMSVPSVESMESAGYFVKYTR